LAFCLASCGTSQSEPQATAPNPQSAVSGSVSNCIRGKETPLTAADVYAYTLSGAREITNQLTQIQQAAQLPEPSHQAYFDQLTKLFDLANKTPTADRVRTNERGMFSLMGLTVGESYLILVIVRQEDGPGLYDHKTIEGLMSGSSRQLNFSMSGEGPCVQ
jgi:hypothetical protein